MSVTKENQNWTYWKPEKIAVLGAGVMGAKIAAVFVNAGFQVLLYDLPGSKTNRNVLIQDAMKGLLSSTPPALVDKDFLKYIQAANYEDDLEQLKSCELIIEAIAEHLDWKEALFAKILPYLSDKSVLASNTSGLSINQLASILPSDLRKRFLGLHFFNPPRYLPLIEIIPAHETDLQLLDAVESFCTEFLGKKVIRAKDTPNFIANRVGVFSLLCAIKYAEIFDLRYDVVDILTGELIGHPKSATFKTLDIIGLDTFAHAVNTMAEDLKDDPWHEFFIFPDWLNKLIEKGSLGDKSNIGIYKKEGNERFVYDAKENVYHKISAKLSREMLAIDKQSCTADYLKNVFKSKHPEAQFLWAYYRDLWQYTAFHCFDIAHNVRDIDCAMKWGFAWGQGPFELWQELGREFIIQKINQDIQARIAVTTPLPEWLFQLPHDFYFYDRAYALDTQNYEPLKNLHVYTRQYFSRIQKNSLNASQVVYEDDAVELWKYSDEICVLGFKTKLGLINRAVLSGIIKALGIAQSCAKALIIFQRAHKNLSAGADIQEFLKSIHDKDFATIENTLATFQSMCLAMRYSKIPVVAALKGYVLGGGCELAMHCAKRVAHMETQMGLAEAGVGLLPAGGGCKEFVRRASVLSKQYAADPFIFLKTAFEAVFLGKVTANAIQAKKMGYLVDSDPILMHPDELLYVAAEQAKALYESGYCPPRPEALRLERQGMEGFNTILAELKAQGRCSEHDELIAQKVAFVFSGANAENQEIADEALILQLERQAFIELCQTDKTRARIEHRLKTGEALRN